MNAPALSRGRQERVRAEARERREQLREAQKLQAEEVPISSPKGPSTHYVRTLGPFWVPKTINKDYLDP